MKYIIEIGDEFKDIYGNKLYKAEGFKSLVFDQNGLNKLKKYEADTTYNEGYKKGYKDGKKIAYQVGYEDARKKFGPLYFEPGDVVKDKKGNKYAFVKRTDDCFVFVVMKNGAINAFAGQRMVFSRQGLTEYGFTKTNEKVALVYIDNVYDKRED